MNEYTAAVLIVLILCLPWILRAFGEILDPVGDREVEEDDPVEDDDEEPDHECDEEWLGWTASCTLDGARTVCVDVEACCAIGAADVLKLDKLGAKDAVVVTLTKHAKPDDVKPTNTEGES